MENPGQEILETYNIPIKRADKIDLPIEHVGVITHFLHQDSDIISAGIFGSRVDESKTVSDSSDIDLGIILNEYDEDKMARIDFKINKRYKSITGDESEIHTCCLNKNVEHALGNRSINQPFRETVNEHIVILKGSSEEF